MVCIHPLGQLIYSDSRLPNSSLNSSASLIRWTMHLSFHPSHLIFEPYSSKLFICNYQGHIAVYNYTSSSLSFSYSFFLQYAEKSPSIIIKSLAASQHSLIVLLHSPTQSLLHFYSHNGTLLQAFSFFNEYISQIRFDNDHLWCLELFSSSLSYFPLQSDQLLGEKTPFLSFKQQSFNPFRFALNQTFIVVMDRAPTGRLLLYDRQTASYIKQIQCPLTDFEPDDIELTNQLLIYRFPHLILLTQLENDQFLEEINANRNLNITIGKSDTEVLVSIATNDQNTFIIQCYAK